MDMEKAVFDMVALGKCEVSGVEYVRGQTFTVTGISTVRWLERNGSAKSGTSLDDGPDGAKVETKKPDDNALKPVKQGTQNGEETDSTPAPSRRKRAR